MLADDFLVREALFDFSKILLNETLYEPSYMLFFAFLFEIILCDYLSSTLMNVLIVSVFVHILSAATKTTESFVSCMSMLRIWRFMVHVIRYFDLFDT